MMPACSAAPTPTGYVINVTPPLTLRTRGPTIRLRHLRDPGGRAAIRPGARHLDGRERQRHLHQPGSPTSQVTGLAQGANVFAWTVDYLTCGTTSDQVTVTAFNPAQAPSMPAPDQQLCPPDPQYDAGCEHRRGTRRGERGAS